MKKLICILMLVALVLSFCACGQEPAEETVPATEPSVEDTTGASGGSGYNTAVTEATKPDCSDINEFEPNEDGVYQIHTPEGLLNMANHPDAEFALLWHIDMGGIKWTPVGTKDQPFTGKIEGGYFTISNFVIDAPNEDGDMGFFGTFAGNVKELNLADVTITTTANTQRAGLWCGYNDDGQFLRCGNATSTLTAESMAANAAIGALVGVNEGDFRNGTMGTSVTVSAAGKADVGGIAGCAVDGKIQFVKNEGSITVTGSDKNVGLFAGTAEQKAEIKGCVFLGAENTVDGSVFTDFVGDKKSEKVTDCLYRDNVKETIDPQIWAMREKAEQTMRAMGEYIWTVPKPLYYSCTCSLTSCAGIYQPGIQIQGIVYNHKSSSLERVKYCMGEDGQLDEWVYLGEYDGFDSYIGSDCSAAVQQAYMSVSSTVEFLNTRNMVPAKGAGTVAVGDWAWDLETVPTYYDVYMEATGEQGMYEAYACLRKGDFIVNQVEAGGHTRFVADDAVVVRNEAGQIDGMESYVITHEQGAPRTKEPYFSSWRVDYKYSFSSLFVDWYVPCTIQEFVYGGFVEPEAHLENAVDGKAGMTTGVVKSTHYLDFVDLVVTNEQGGEAYRQRLFTTVGKTADNNNNVLIRRNVQEFDLARFATPLREFMFEPGQTYNYTLTVHLGTGDDFVVHEGTFTNGTAQ